MKVLQLQAENFKGLKAVEIIPPDDIVKVSGANGMGKTSCIDSIWAALTGGKDIKHPIHEGEHKAHIVISVGDDIPALIVQRSWEQGKKPKLEVFSPDGAKYTKPQAVIDAMMNQYTFDPLEFSRMNPKDQVKTLMQLIGAEDRLEQLEEDRQEAYGTRTLVNRQIKQVMGELQGLPFVHHTTPDEPISIKELAGQLLEAEKDIMTLQAIEADITYTEHAMETAQKRIVELQKQIEAEHTIVEGCKSQINQQKIKISTYPVPLIDEIKAKINEAEVTNKHVAEKQKRIELQDKLQDVKQQSENWTNRIFEIDSEKEQIIKDANLPLPGLGFDDSGVTYDGKPLTDCSNMEQMEISASVIMAMKPKLSIMRITDGSSVDSKHMAKLQQMCEENGFQMWIEVVDETGNVGFYIEEGEVRRDNYHEEIN